MLWWDRELKTRMENLKIECRRYKTYADDINMAIEITPPGMTFKDNQIYVDRSTIHQDQTVSADKRIMLLIQKTGNDIHPSIQLEVDFPSNHEDGKCPY